MWGRLGGVAAWEHTFYSGYIVTRFGGNGSSAAAKIRNSIDPISSIIGTVIYTDT